MAAKLTRIEKSKNSKGYDEIFINIEVSDELGMYNFGKWLTDDEFCDLQDDYADTAKFDAFEHYRDFRSLVPTVGVIISLVNKYAVVARLNKEKESVITSAPVTPE